MTAEFEDDFKAEYKPPLTKHEAVREGTPPKGRNVLHVLKNNQRKSEVRGKSSMRGRKA